MNKQIVELYASNLEPLLKDFGINGKKTYTGKGWHNSQIEVWEITKDEMLMISEQSDKEFHEKYADLEKDIFWRYAEGSNMGVPDAEFNINGISIKAWDSAIRVEEDALYNPDDEDDEKYSDIFPREYNNLLMYLCEEMGASMERNVCALAVDLAKYNNMTMGELFNKCQ